MNEHLRDESPELLRLRDPDWVASLVTWLASAGSAGVSGRIFEAWGNGYSVIESWQHGPQTASTKDPSSLGPRSEEHTSELQSLMRISYAVFCLKKKTTIKYRT